MSIIGAIIAGAIIGALGRLILPGKQNISVLMTVVIGVVAGLIGGAILSRQDHPFLGWILGAILAAVGIVIYGNMSSKKV